MQGRSEPRGAQAVRFQCRRIIPYRPRFVRNCAAIGPRHASRGDAVRAVTRGQARDARAPDGVLPHPAAQRRGAWSRSPRPRRSRRLRFPGLPQGPAAAPVIRHPLTPHGNATRQPMAGALPCPAAGVRCPRPPPSPEPTVPVPFSVAVQSGQEPSLRPLSSAFVSGFRGPRCSWAASSPGAHGSRGQPPPEATVPARRAFPRAGASVTQDPAASSTARVPDLRPGNTTRTA